MFGVIVDYQSEEFYKQHKYISFDTIYEKQTYEVVAAIQTELPSDSAEGFRYNEYTGSDEKSFAEYVKFIGENKLYDTGVQISPGDKLLTLSTCAYHTESGRFIVIAKRYEKVHRPSRWTFSLPLIPMNYAKRSSSPNGELLLFGDPYGNPRLRASRVAALTCHRHVIHYRSLRFP